MNLEGLKTRLMSVEDVTCEVSDWLSRRGHGDSAIAGSCFPVRLGQLPLVGPACTVQLALDLCLAPTPDDLHGRVVAAITPGEVLVVAVASDRPAATMGAVAAGRFLAAGCAGCLVDGYVRDVAGLSALGIPVLAHGVTPLSLRRRLSVVAVNETVYIGGVPVTPGAWIIADANGAVVVPAELLPALPEAAAVWPTRTQTS